VLAFVSIFPGIGLYLLCEAVNQGIDSETTEGTVVAFETHRDSDDNETYAAVVEYAVAEKRYRCRGVASRPAIHYRGQKVRVLYQLDNPAVGHVDSFMDRWLGGLFFTVIGIPFFAWAVFSLFFSRMYYRWLKK
jgi:Protein of unknown function (DUF3592)